MKRNRLIKLLKMFSRGGSLAELWDRAGYSSRHEAVEEVKELIESLGGEKAKAEQVVVKGKNLSDLVMINVDGASRGNPGPAAAAAVAFSPDGEELLSRSVYLGKVTNNEAEYRAVLEGLKLALELAAKRVLIRMDSELVYRQIIGEYRVKSPHLFGYCEEVKELEKRFDECRFERVPRAMNAAPDKIANEVLDRQAAGGND